MEDSKDMVVAQQKMLNGVAYESLPETSIAVARTFEKQFFQKSTYGPNNEALCDFNTGAKFVNPRRSYLCIKVTSTVEGKGANFGHGSICNLIRRVVVTSRSGVELSRTEDYNILMAKLLRYSCPQDWIDKFGENLGLVDTTASLGTQIEQLEAKTVKTFMIPLHMVSPFFEGDGRSLIPPQAAAGLRLQLTLADAKQALVSNEPTQSYLIEDIFVMTNVTTMVDSWQKLVNEESASDGLTYSFPEWHTTQNTTAQAGSNIEVRKAVAKALCAFVVTKSLANLTANDNMKSDAYSTTSFQWRLGSLYPTQQPITDSKEAYFQAQNLWNGGILDCKRPNAVSYSQFAGSTAPVLATGTSDGDGIVAVTLERNDISLNGVLNISGNPTNNSKILSVNMVDAPPVARTQYMFMKHLRVAKFYLDNSILSE